MTAKRPLKFRLGGIDAFVGLDGETELSRAGVEGEAALRDKGIRPDIRALRLAWGIIFVWARKHGIARLYCEPTRGWRYETRVRVYRRAGFDFIDPTGHDTRMYCDLEETRKE